MSANDSQFSKTVTAHGSCAPSPGSAIPALKELRRYGFSLTQIQRQIMREERKRGGVPTETDEANGVLMSRHFVAHDGKTYTARMWVFPGGSTYSYDDDASSPNAERSEPPTKTKPNTKND